MTCRENIHYDLLRTGSVEITVNRLLERGYLDAVSFCQLYILLLTLFFKPPPAYTRAFPPSPSISTTTTQPSSTSQPKAESKPKSLIERFHLESQAAAQKPISQQKEEEWDGKGPIPLSAKGKGRAEPLRFDDGSAQGIIDAGKCAPLALSCEGNISSGEQITKGGVIGGRSVEGRIGVGRPIYEGGTTGIGKPTTNPKPGGGVWEATPEKRMEALRRKKEEMILAARKRLLEKEATEKA